MHSTQQPCGGERCSGFQPCRKASLSMPQIDRLGCPAQGGPALYQSTCLVRHMKYAQHSAALMGREVLRFPVLQERLAVHAPD